MWGHFVLAHVGFLYSVLFLVFFFFLFLACLKLYLFSGEALLLCSQISLLGVLFITSPLGKSLTLISLFANSPYEQVFNHQHRWPTFRRPSWHALLLPLIAHIPNKPYLLNTSLIQSFLPGALESIKRNIRSWTFPLGIQQYSEVVESVDSGARVLNSYSKSATS